MERIPGRKTRPLPLVCQKGYKKNLGKGFLDVSKCYKMAIYIKDGCGEMPLKTIYSKF
jgi:hypothetical protein